MKMILSKIAEIINKEDIKAISICFLHSYINPNMRLKVEIFAQHIKDDVVISLIS